MNRIESLPIEIRLNIVEFSSCNNIGIPIDDIIERIQILDPSFTLYGYLDELSLHRDMKALYGYDLFILLDTNERYYIEFNELLTISIDHTRIPYDMVSSLCKSMYPEMSIKNHTNGDYQIEVDESVYKLLQYNLYRLSIYKYGRYNPIDIINRRDIVNRYYSIAFQLDTTDSTLMMITGIESLLSLFSMKQYRDNSTYDLVGQLSLANEALRNQGIISRYLVKAVNSSIYPLYLQLRDMKWMLEVTSDNGSIDISYQGIDELHVPDSFISEAVYCAHNNWIDIHYTVRDMNLVYELITLCILYDNRNLQWNYEYIIVR